MEAPVALTFIPLTFFDPVSPLFEVELVALVTSLKNSLSFACCAALGPLARVIDVSLGVLFVFSLFPTTAAPTMGTACEAIVEPVRDKPFAKSARS